MRALPPRLSICVFLAGCAPLPNGAPVPEDRAQLAAPASPSALASEAPSAGSLVEPSSTAPATGRVMFNFSNAGLPDLVRAISEVTGKRFIVTGNLPPLEATLYSPDPITADEAYQAFLGVLATNGLTVVPRGRLLVITPSPGLGRGR